MIHMLSLYIYCQMLFYVLATYWMSSSVLCGKISFSYIFFLEKALYLCLPRVFSCICFVRNLSPALDKLSPCYLNVCLWSTQVLKKAVGATILYRKYFPYAVILLLSIPFLPQYHLLTNFVLLFLCICWCLVQD